LDAIAEETVAALDNKNPQIKAETALFLSRCFSHCTQATLPKKLLKLFCGAFLKVRGHVESVLCSMCSLIKGLSGPLHFELKSGHFLLAFFFLKIFVQHLL
jgi:hypothetical protein